MNPKGLLLRVLLNGAHGGVKESLLRALPKEDAEAVLSYSIAHSDPAPLLHQVEHALAHIHYSWIHEYMSPLEPAKQKAVLSCLEDNHRVAISRLLHQEPPAPQRLPLLKKFYLRYLYPLVPLEANLPLEYIPENSFSSLLNLTKRQLVELISLLGMYDLAHEIKKIVATKNMKNLYTCLSPQRQKFLRLCIHHKDKIATPPLSLEKWNGDPQKLNQMLHYRGLARLGLALSGQQPDFLWYLCHKLDMGRGRLLQKMIPKEDLPALTTALSLQVENAKNFLIERSLE
jgi:hypothetical protein